MMTRDQTAIAVPLLNSYAHQYLGLSMDAVIVSGGQNADGWWLIVVADGKKPELVPDFDAAKALIDAVRPASLQGDKDNA